MPWGIAASVVGSIAGAAIAADAAGDAADAQAGATRDASAIQAQASREATAEQRRQFDLARDDLEPWRTSGRTGLEQLQALLGREPSVTPESVMGEPGYQFGLQQGLRNMQNTAAARGGLYSGATLRDLTRFGTDYATTKFNDSFNRQQAAFGNRWGRLAALAGIGQSATNQSIAAGQNFANQNQANLLGTAGQIAGNTIGAGNAAAASRLSQGNAYGNAFGQLASMGRQWWETPSAQPSVYQAGSGYINPYTYDQNYG